MLGVAFADRRSGRINAHGLRVSGRSVGERMIGGDLKWLRMACRIALRDRLLQSDPTFGLPIPINSNPVRPVYTQDDFEALLSVAPQLHRYFGQLVIFANEFGRRFAAYAGLKWSDINLSEGTVTWRADTDKLNTDWITPLPPATIRVNRAD